MWGPNKRRVKYYDFKNNVLKNACYSRLLYSKRAALHIAAANFLKVLRILALPLAIYSQTHLPHFSSFPLSITRAKSRQSKCTSNCFTTTAWRLEPPHPRLSLHAILKHTWLVCILQYII